MTPNAVSITVVLTAFNQERMLEATLCELRRFIPQYFLMWEFLIFDDGSRDRTGPIAERLALYDENIRVFHHPKQLGPAACYREAIREAAFEHLILTPITPNFDAQPLHRIFEAAGTADIIVPHATNRHNLPLSQRLWSPIFTGIVNKLSGFRVPDYSGPVLHRTELAKSCPPSALGFAYQAEVLIKLLKRGHSIRGVGVELSQKHLGLTRLLKWLKPLAPRSRA